MKIDSLDHLVLTVADIVVSCDFYRRVLGMEVVSFLETRKALHFGNQKINLHELGGELSPNATRPTPGSADLCFLTSTPLSDVITQLRDQGVDILEGPVTRTGANGPILSVYIRDPDHNLIEIANRLPAHPTL